MNREMEVLLIFIWQGEGSLNGQTIPGKEKGTDGRCYFIIGIMRLSTKNDSSQLIFYLIISVLTLQYRGSTLPQSPSTELQYMYSKQTLT